MALWESPALNLSWEPALEDYAEAFRARNRARGVPMKIAVMAALALVAALVGFATDQEALIAGGLSGVLTVAYLAGPGQSLMVKSFWKRSVQLHAPTQVQVLPIDGITSTIPGVTIHFTWSKFDSVLETDRVFVVQLATHRKGAFVIIAKRGLASADDVSRLREVLITETGRHRETADAMPQQP